MLKEEEIKTLLRNEIIKLNIQMSNAANYPVEEGETWSYQSQAENQAVMGTLIHMTVTQITLKIYEKKKHDEVRKMLLEHKLI